MIVYNNNNPKISSRNLLDSNLLKRLDYINRIMFEHVKMLNIIHANVYINNYNKEVIF